MAEVFKVTFWGVRGSYPAPGKDKLQFGGNTTCLEVSIEGATIIIDAGTGIINLGQKLVSEYVDKGGKGPLELTLLFTHLHHDHTQGLPFFVPLYLGQSLLHFFGPRNFGNELNVTLERSMIPPNFPVDFYHASSVKEVTTVKENNIILLDTKILTPRLLNRYHDKAEVKSSTIIIRVMNNHSHPANGVFVYRIEYGGKSIVFATDVEGYVFGDVKLIEFARGTDLLIHDSQYSIQQYTALPTPKQGYGHSTPEMAIGWQKKRELKISR